MTRLLLIALALALAAPVVDAAPKRRGSAQKSKQTSKQKSKQKPKKPKPQRSPEQQQADRHFKSGVALFEEAKFAEALAEFERAYEIAPHPLVLYNIAGCHRELSSYGEAIKAYERFLTEGKGEVPAARLRAARAELEGILARIARVSVSVGPMAGAALVLDGAELGTLPLPMPLILPPGEHELIARAAGYRDANRKLRVASGDELEIELTLAAVPVEATPVEPVTPRARESRARRFAIGAGFGTNLGRITETGAPSLGLGVALGRLQLGVDVVIVAYAAMPSVRFRLLGDTLSVHLIGAVPIVFPGDEMGGETFVAGAGGLGLRYRPTRALAFRLESLASFAGEAHGTTFPAFIGGELWF